MTPRMDLNDTRLEGNISPHGDGEAIKALALYSQAISLKRIATALEAIANRLPATAPEIAAGAGAAQAGADGWMEGWNEHHGDPWVVSGDMPVDARLRDGQILTERAKHLSWTYSRGSDSPNDIVSWKLHASRGTNE